MSYRKIQEHDIPVIKVSEEGKSKIAAKLPKFCQTMKLQSQGAKVLQQNKH